jgi:rhamnogalacturonan endolyase
MQAPVCCRRIISTKAALVASFMTFAALAGLPVQANVPGGGTDGPDVTLVQTGHTAVLANGTITATLNTQSAEIISIRFHGKEFVSDAGVHKRIYFSRDGGATYENISHCVTSVVKKTPDTIDISCKHTYTPAANDRAPWDVDVHFALRKGASGLYISVVNSHPASYPDLNVGEWRMVWSTPQVQGEHLLENIYVDSVRHWLLPSPDDMSKAVPVPGAPKEVSKLTTGSWKDRLDCKYMYAAPYWEMGCWGFASNKNHLGGWFVFGSHEFFNDGPTKQDLDVAVGTGLVHLNMNHYNGTGFRIKQGEEWTKCYGPYLFYCNNKPGGDACWEDAKAQAVAEQAAWPYDWVDNTAYPLAQARGSVQGKLIIKDSLNPT